MAEEEKKPTWSEKVATQFTRGYPMLGALFDTDESDRMYQDRQRARLKDEEDLRAKQMANEYAANDEARKQQTHELGMKAGEEAFRARQEENAFKARARADAEFNQSASNYVKGLANGLTDPARAKVLGDATRGVGVLNAINRLLPQAMKEAELPDGSPTPTIDVIRRNAAAYGYDLDLDKKMNLVVRDLRGGKTYTYPPKEWQRFNELVEGKAQGLRSMAILGDPGVGVGNTGYKARTAMETALGPLSEQTMEEANKFYNYLYNNDLQALTIFALLKSYDDAKRLDGPVGKQLRDNMVDNLKSIGITATEREDGGYSFYNPNRVLGMDEFYEDAETLFRDLAQHDTVTPRLQKKRADMAKAAAANSAAAFVKQRRLEEELRLAKAKADKAESESKGGQVETSLSKEQEDAVKGTVPDYSFLGDPEKKKVSMAVTEANNAAAKTGLLTVNNDGLFLSKNALSLLKDDPKELEKRVDSAIDILVGKEEVIREQVKKGRRDAKSVSYQPLVFLKNFKKDLRTARQSPVHGPVEVYREEGLGNSDLILTKHFLINRFASNPKIVDILDNLPENPAEWSEYLQYPTGAKEPTPRIAALPLEDKFVKMLWDMAKKRSRIENEYKEKDRQRIPRGVY